MVSADLARLYQLPLAEFTAARNALAKAAGQKGDAIRALEKPSVPAWAVNQLYWRERRVYDKLIRASERVRAAHAQVLAGKRVELPTLEAQHAAAVKGAADAVRTLLLRSGDPATPATMKAVVDTLQALPGGGTPGQLTKALAPIGFGAFGVLMQGAASAKTMADVVTFVAPKPPKPSEDEQAAARKRAAAERAKQVKALEAEGRKLAGVLERARAVLAKAEADLAKADAAAKAAGVVAERARAEVARIEREARATDQERARLASS